MSKTAITETPWLALAGFLSILSYFLNSQIQTGVPVDSTRLPLLLTEGLFLIALGLMLTGKPFGMMKTPLQEDKVYVGVNLMGLFWILNQAVVWLEMSAFIPIVSWVTAILNILVFLELLGITIIPLVQNDDIAGFMVGLNSIFASRLYIFILLIFAVVNVYYNVNSGIGWIHPHTLWSMALGAIALGNLSELGEYQPHLRVIGGVIAVYVAVTLSSLPQQIELTLLMI